jgi:hypothetical protein
LPTSRQEGRSQYLRSDRFSYDAVQVYLFYGSCLHGGAARPLADQSVAVRGAEEGHQRSSGCADDQMRPVRYVHNAKQRAFVGWPGVLLEELRRATCSQRLRGLSRHFTLLARVFASYRANFPSISVRGRRRQSSGRSSSEAAVLRQSDSSPAVGTE